MAEIKLRDISKSYGDKVVLKNINLEIEDGEFLTLVGPSGCGKSTLLRIIAGLEPQTSGHLELAGKLMDGVRPSQRDLAMVFQSYALYPHLSVYENIAVPLKMRKLNKLQRLPFAAWLSPKVRRIQREINENITETAKLLGLEEMLNSKPGKLSGGQRQRVAVGRAIVRDPKAFLFDEPLSNLDAKLRVHMRTEITRLHESLQSTFVYVTHDQVEAMTMSDRIAVMMDGDIIQLGTATEVYDRPNDIRVAQFIGSPKINLFAAEVNDYGNVSLRDQALPITLDEAHANSKITLGVRPEKLRIVTGESKGLQGRIELLENLGSEIFVHVRVMEQEEPIVLRLTREGAGHLTLKQIITLEFTADEALVFDANGARVDPVMSTPPEALYA